MKHGGAAAEPPPAESDDSTVRAAGALVWRRTTDRLELALVHRPKYEDWSWPKGKLDPGESWAGACVREVLEETGLHVRLGLPLPDARYIVGTNGISRPKVVRYWAAHVVAELGQPDAEVDEVLWLDVAEAAQRLDYQRDRDQLQALTTADALGRLETWPLAVVRHAKSVPRSRWKHDELHRPLLDTGMLRAEAIVPVLAAYGVRTVVSSPSARCVATLEPYARLAGVRVRLREGLSEEGFADDPTSTVGVVDNLLAKGVPAAVCSHRPVLSTLLQTLAQRCPDASIAHAQLESAGPGLVKGEVLVAHIRGRGPGAEVVAVERHDTR